MDFDCKTCGWTCKADFTPSMQRLTAHLHRSAECLAAVDDLTQHAGACAAQAKLARLTNTAKTAQQFDADETSRRSIFASEAKNNEAMFLSTQRYDKFQRNTDIQSWKDGVPALLKDRRLELMRRLSSNVSPGHDLDAIVGDVMNIFDGINTEKAEAADLKLRLGSRLVKPKQRILGTRTLQTTDSEGFKCGEKKTSERCCYDLPIDATLGALLQHDERARRQFCSASRRWAAGAGDASGSEKIYFDIPDGKAFKSHPMLGTNSPAVDGFKGAIMLYYDGFEVS
jgi:hypothetical protein